MAWILEKNKTKTNTEAESRFWPFSGSVYFYVHIIGVYIHPSKIFNCKARK